MKSRDFVLDDQLAFTVYKRASSRQIRLTIDPSGKIKVSIPNWVPYKSAVAFVKTKQDWINKRRPEPTILKNGQQIGKNHRLSLRTTGVGKKITTRVSDLEAIVYYPLDQSVNSPWVQTAAKRVAKKAMTRQAEQLLPIRTEQLAQKYGYKFASVQIKNTKTRWGSCDSKKNIALNPHLMQLPWELIDYVILHELNHTQFMHHGPAFWANLESKLPNTKELRKNLKSHRSVV